MTVSYARGASDTPLLELTIGAMLEQAAARFPANDALVESWSGRRWSYRELNAAVDLVARALLAVGIRAGDRVGIWAPNCAEWLLVQLATAKVGAILVTVNPAYRAHELEFAVKHAGLRLLVSAASYKTSDYRGMVAAVAPQCPSLERVVLIDDPSWDEFVAAGVTVSPDRLRGRSASLSNADPINIQFTSGTTGSPKGATLTHRNILNNAYFVGELLGYTADDRVCVPVPFYHCFGMVMGNLACVAHGACVVVPAPTFDAEATLRAVVDERCTSLYGVPTMFIAALEHERFGEFDLRSLRTGIMAGSPCPIEVMRRVVAEMHMAGVSICYGMTETSPVSTQTRMDDELELRVSTVGRPVPHVEVKVVDPETGATLPCGRSGELCTRGYSVMSGYWDEPAKTAEVVDADGWMHTGDLATMDEQGYCNIVGRIKDMVIRGGENLYPREIEEFLHGHPDVVEVQVVGVPDERMGEELCAWIRARPGSGLDEAAVRAFCRGRIAHHKIPRYVRFVAEFPMTVTGKVQKFELREMAIRDLGLTAADRIATA